MRTEEYFQQRAARADRTETLRILAKAGKGNRPVQEDILPAGWAEEHFAEPQQKNIIKERAPKAPGKSRGIGKTGSRMLS